MPLFRNIEGGVKRMELKNRDKGNLINVIICGVGGQGNILISRLIGRVLSQKGYFITIGETFGAAQRGGAVFSSLRISDKTFYGPLIPKGGAHVVLALEPLGTLRILNDYGNPDVMTLTNLQPVYPVGVLAGNTTYPDLSELTQAIEKLSCRAWFLNATKMATELGAAIATNIIMLGALVGSRVLPMDSRDAEEEIKNTFPPKSVDLNLKALALGTKETAKV